MKKPNYHDFWPSVNHAIISKFPEMADGLPPQTIENFKRLRCARHPKCQLCKDR